MASWNQRKQGYRTLALKYHPGRNHIIETEEKFKDIAEG
ncbi:MAG: DnaJ domain-containing protein [Nitrospira sp.]|nr:DnaJ domain-containing protein [Nitrospira sp.]